MVLFPPKGQDPTPPDLYGARTTAAVALPEIRAPERDRVFCMTVMTTDDRDRGKPSSWSAELDMLTQGARDGRRRLMLIPAGTVRPQDQWKHFPYGNDTEQIHDPGQAWNALTVGAYTEKWNLDSAVFPGHRPLAMPGALSPSSSTSVTWDKTWPIKPDIVMEGGNASLISGGDLDLPADLRLLSAHWHPMAKLLVDTGDTSGATALAAGLAGTLSARLRDDSTEEVWPETIRALIVHSARWTTAMTSEFPELTPTRQKDYRLRRFGWGVPSLERATWSATNALTLVAQRTIQPFENIAEPRRSPKVRTRDWHVFDLPWPVQTLQDLGGVQVELRVTLSYFVEPNPGRRGWRKRHEYRSAGLHFAVKGPLESIEDFRARMSKNDQDEEHGLPTFSDPGWELGSLRSVNYFSPWRQLEFPT